ncbi:MAG: DUF1799 domain-containing protein [Thermomonas sp.]|uniref:DUF1799 domain-containing protein n=1 Tax=Thermomonas sp. TaxID=1971895 RepID=UPI00261255EE|nr:DUF1799 domain-containing protein [Thermomonas sp.]MCC7097267.1 DUF1799 domain-containing protein [Thermomonas sp.]
MLLARAWAGEAPTGLAEAAEEARLLGVPTEAVDAMLATRQDIGVWPENYAVLEAFLTVASQWRTVPLQDGRVHYVGLDHGACRASLDLSGLSVTPEVWAGVRVMEGAAKNVLNGVAGRGG